MCGFGEIKLVAGRAIDLLEIFFMHFHNESFHLLTLPECSTVNSATTLSLLKCSNRSFKQQAEQHY
ncbi:hypothetical protein TUM4261_28570 [Shewanella sp. c952]|nr:hypothetical protein TUM4261_28570 [Shewanella sp. c952]